MISVVGHTAIDHIFNVKALPGTVASTPAYSHDILYGGGAANIAAGIAVLGGNAGLVSVVGKDFKGSSYEAWLNKLGVNLNLCAAEDSNTPACYMFNDPEGKQTTVLEWNASRRFETMEAPALKIAHLATGLPEFNMKIADKAEFVSFDPGQDLINYTKEHLDYILQRTDILFCNMGEFKEICRKTGLNGDELLKSVPTAVVTKSEEGSELHTNNNGDVKTIPAVKSSFADPTGAGDSYRAGFFTAYEKGYPLTVCCMTGAVTSSFVIEKTGCQTNLPDWKMMQARYENVFGKYPE